MFKAGGETTLLNRVDDDVRAPGLSRAEASVKLRANASAIDRRAFEAEQAAADMDPAGRTARNAQRRMIERRLQRMDGSGAERDPVRAQTARDAGITEISAAIAL